MSSSSGLAQGTVATFPTPPLPMDTVPSLPPCVPMSSMYPRVSKVPHVSLMSHLSPHISHNVLMSPMCPQCPPCVPHVPVLSPIPQCLCPVAGGAWTLHGQLGHPSSGPVFLWETKNREEEDLEYRGGPQKHGKQNGARAFFLHFIFGILLMVQGTHIPLHEMIPHLGKWAPLHGTLPSPPRCPPPHPS